MVMNQGWPAHQGWIPYQIGQSVCNGYNCPISQSIYIFNIRPASWSTMDLLMYWPDRVAHVRWGILKQGGQSEMGKVTEGAAQKAQTSQSWTLCVGHG